MENIISIFYFIKNHITLAFSPEHIISIYGRVGISIEIELGKGIKTLDNMKNIFILFIVLNENKT